MNYQDLYYFVKVVECGSITAASHRFDIPISTLSRRLMALEDQLGFQLLHRTAKSFGLTDAGDKFFSRVSRQLNDVEYESENLLSELTGLTGDLKVSAPLAFGRNVVNKWVTEFIRLHPGISIELLLSNQPIDLVKQGVDVALRLGNIGLADWVARDIKELDYVLVASPAFLEREGKPSHPRELEALPAVVSSGTPLWRLSGPDGDLTVHPRSHFKSDVVSACIDSAVEGIGIGLAPRFAVQRHLKSGALVGVLPGWRVRGKMLRILYPSRENLPAKNRAFIEFILEKGKTLPN